MTLLEHRQALAKNPDAYTYEFRPGNIERLVRTLRSNLRNAGYRFNNRKSSEILKKLILLLFEAQDYRPFFHVEGTDLPLCWNSPMSRRGQPSGWEFNYIKYEWGHLKSRNQNPSEEYGLENLGLYSARCNQHIQTSLNIEELMVYGGILAQRISNVLTARRKLFEASEWKDAVDKLLV